MRPSTAPSDGAEHSTFRYRIERVTPAAVHISMAGELDVYAAPIARSFLGRILDSGPARIIVDASGISFVDAAGVGVVAFAARRARSYGGELVMDRVTAGMAQVLDLTGVSRLLGAADTDTPACVPAAL